MVITKLSDDPCSPFPLLALIHEAIQSLDRRRHCTQKILHRNLLAARGPTPGNSPGTTGPAQASFSGQSQPLIRADAEIV
jgi:hypothetical protein